MTTKKKMHTATYDMKSLKRLNEIDQDMKNALCEIFGVADEVSPARGEEGGFARCSIRTRSPTTFKTSTSRTCPGRSRASRKNWCVQRLEAHPFSRRRAPTESSPAAQLKTFGAASSQGKQEQLEKLAAEVAEK